MKLSTTIVLLFSFCAAFGQKIPIKFGKMEASNIKMKTYEADPSAEAVVLADYGVSFFDYNEQNGFMLNFRRITRIKILTKDGLDFGNFEIDYYHDQSDRESVFEIKGITYNDEKGKIVQTKLDKKSIYDEELNEYWDEKKFSMPNVKEGSVVEVSYKIRSPFIYNLREWEFQSTIPTLASEYSVSIPEYFHYQKITYGYIQLGVENSSSIGSITSTSSQRGYNKATTLETSAVHYTNNIEHYIASNVPAFKEEPYLTTRKDYISRIAFELKFTQYPQTPIKQYMGTWESLNKTFLENDRFGEAIKHTAFAKDEVEKITTGKSDEEKIVAVFNFVRNSMVWNGYYRKFISSPSLKSTFDDHKGSSSDINLLLTGLLNRVDIKANPVLVSTRDHGRPRPNFAISDQFNYVICAAELNGKIILLDATDKSLPAGVLPMRCLNGQGWRVSSDNPGWVKISATKGADNLIMVDVSLDNGETVGKVNRTQKGYSAYNSRHSIQEKGKEKYIEDLKKKSNDWTIDDYQIENLDDVNSPLKHTFSFSFPENTDGDILYINPLLNLAEKENPFKRENREYPVDFGYPIKQTIIVSFTIPDGYAVDELPKPSATVTPDQSAIFRYNVSNLGQKLQVVSSVEIKKSTYVPSEYPALREFYNVVVAKEAEQIVLKKKN